MNELSPPLPRLQRGKLRIFFQYWFPVGLYMGLIVALSSDSTPEQHFPDSLELLNDKVAHACEYAVLGFLLFRVFRFGTKSFRDRRAILWAIVTAIGFGMTDEIHQYFVPYREMDVWDLFADGIGATVGTAGGATIYRLYGTGSSVWKISLLGFLIICQPFSGMPAAHAETSQQAQTWDSLNQAGMRAFQRNQLATAKSLFLEALTSLDAITENDPRRAITLNNLGAVHEHLGEYEEAELRYRHSLAIIESIQGSDHPDVVLGLNNLAAFYERQHKLNKAEPLRRRAVFILRTVLGEMNPHVVPSLLHLAAILEAQGQWPETEDLYRQALRITEQGLGPQHPQKALILERYAQLLRLWEREEEAAVLEQEARSIRENLSTEATP